MRCNIRIYLFFMVCLVSLLPTMAESDARLFPTAADKYWKKNIPAAMRNDYIQLGNRYMNKAWIPISGTLFAGSAQTVIVRTSRWRALPGADSLPVSSWQR